MRRLGISLPDIEQRVLLCIFWLLFRIWRLRVCSQEAKLQMSGGKCAFLPSKSDSGEKIGYQLAMPI